MMMVHLMAMMKTEIISSKMEKEELVRTYFIPSRELLNCCLATQEYPCLASSIDPDQLASG